MTQEEDCLPPESYVPNVVSVSGLSSSWVLCYQCCQCLWIVFLLSLMCPMLSVSLDCLPPESYVPNVVSVSELSSYWVLCTQCCQCLWIVFLLSLMYPMLSVSLNCLPPESYVPIVASVSGLSSSWVLCAQCCQCLQSRDTGNIGYIRLRRKTIQRHWQHWVHKTQEEDNPETRTTMGT
jgi:hypothetical protein